MNALSARTASETLSQKQRRFASMTVKLFSFLEQQGYQFTYGDAFRDPRVHGAVGVKLGYGAANSLHKQKLAIDINLFRDGKYLTSTEAHKLLGEYWESLGGTWGGRFSDGNHYSLAHAGQK